MAAVLPLAMSAALAAPRTSVSGAPSPAPFLGTRAYMSLRLRGSPRAVACALRRRPTKYKTKIQNEDVAAEDDMDDEDEDGALEALFKQLEEDLENDDLSVDGDDDGISEEDMARFEKELAAAIEDVGGADESTGDFFLSFEESGNDEKVYGSKQLELKSWQLRRLARALKIGRRKTSIKNLAGELGLDRALVIELLRNPPPKLLLISDSLPDETPLKPEVKEIEPSSYIIADEAEAEAAASHATEINPEMELPVHVRNAEWSARKRLKKVQLETLERVYLRSKRPTNTMISSIVQVTNLPRKTIVKWFEDRREQDGVPDHCAAFKRSLSETVASL
ncbi:hypothetical protein PR202_gb27826 [Eleusine coracana subsp. coracana]|uniref:Homeobox domain-containing protein n=1 Tax=Eleusine coracana subsp. coracana TaxID=191504 RepID=A0AAV5FVU2_ELECO|nr:hypothetical protein QOZ80_6AG0544250 [Eleusine coracana subsp. coracana]GJN38757.1 hypothetical protein PR202_gb27826 [Eleusine coracana subsp. coracana]